MYGVEKVGRGGIRVYVGTWINARDGAREAKSWRTGVYWFLDGYGLDTNLHI
jgi:hypothetical protein